MNWWDRLLRPAQSARSNAPLSFSEFEQYFGLNGLGYPLTAQQTLIQKAEEIRGDFPGMSVGAYQASSVVHACMSVRSLLFSEARFQFRRLVNGRPGEFFGTASLGLLETPWPNGTSGDLLGRAIQDVDLAGNAFIYRKNAQRLVRLRPDWVTIMLGSRSDPDVVAGDLDADLVGYLYHPGGRGSGREPTILLPENVAHFAPSPDPVATYRGVSWLRSVLTEVTADSAATTHKLKFFENGATPNMVVSLAPEIPKEKFDQWIAAFEASHDGVYNAYKTLYLGGGADAKVVGADMKQIDFKTTQGHGETRIAAAAGVPPIIVGLSEGLESATYSNYGQARRRFADATIRPLWRNFCDSLKTIIDIPAGAQLWYDDRDIPFLQEDQKDAADIRQVDANAIKALTEAGYEPKSVIDAVTAGDLKRLKHTGQFSVQLQPPGNGQAQTNGASPVPVPTP